MYEIDWILFIMDARNWDVTSRRRLVALLVPLVAALLAFTWWKTRRRRKMAAQGRIVLITGCTSGLGEACARVFYKAGARLILCSRNIEQLKTLQSHLKEDEDGALFQPHIVKMDLSQPESVEKGVKDALDCYGKVDVLINNAGVSSRSLALDTTMEVERYIMEVNFFGPVALTKALLPSMMRERTGHIVTISSVQGKVGIPLRTSYSASKHSVQGYYDALRNEVSPYGIQVSVISPGYIRTNLSRNALQGDGTAHGVLDETTAKGMSPESVAMAILDTVMYGDRDLIIASLSSRIAIWLNFFCPSVLDWVLRRRAGKAIQPKQQ